jgi:hypothetical protein
MASKIAGFFEQVCSRYEWCCDVHIVTLGYAEAILLLSRDQKALLGCTPALLS